MPEVMHHPSDRVGAWEGMDEKRWRFVLVLEPAGAEGRAVASARISDPRRRVCAYAGHWGVAEGATIIQLSKAPEGGMFFPGWFVLTGLRTPDGALTCQIRGDDCSCSAQVVLRR